MSQVKHWLQRLENPIGPFQQSQAEPICFLIGASASLSSGAPGQPDRIWRSVRLTYTFVACTACDKSSCGTSISRLPLATFRLAFDQTPART
jgi:hypothetical protein